MPTEPIPSGDIISQFDLFWAAYPRKIGKGQARRAWRGAEKKAGGTLILDSLELQRRAGTFDRDRQFIPHPATWLNGERWSDEIEVARQPYRNGASELARQIDELSWRDGLAGPDPRIGGPAGD